MATYKRAEAEDEERKQLFKIGIVPFTSYEEESIRSDKEAEFDEFMNQLTMYTQA